MARPDALAPDASPEAPTIANLSSAPAAVRVEVGLLLRRYAVDPDIAAQVAGYKSSHSLDAKAAQLRRKGVIARPPRGDAG